MLNITLSQRRSIGFLAVTEMLAPASPYGREALRCLVPVQPGEQAELERGLYNVERTLAVRGGLEQHYKQIEHLLRQFKDIRTALKRCRDGQALDEVELFEIKRYLLQLSALCALFRQIDEVAAYSGIAFTDEAEALRLLDPEGNRVATFHLSGRHSPGLTAIRREKRAFEQRMREAPPEDQAGLAAARGALAAREQEEEARIRGLLSQQLQPFMPSLLQNADAIADLDLTMQKAALAARHGCCKPVIGGSAVHFAEMNNPRISHLLEEQGKRFTPLTITLSQGATVITGANMGGKSVALKTAALNVLLIHCGFYPFAREARCPLFHSMHIISEDLESVDRGLSSFGGEILRLGEALRAVEEGFSIVFMDEFARGTNPAEGAAIARGVAEHLDGKQSVTVMTTHYDGVAEAAGAHYQVVGLARMNPAALRLEAAAKPEEERVALIGRYMDYGLVRVGPGQAMPRDAMNICSLLGLDEAVMGRIEKYLKED